MIRPKTSRPPRAKNFDHDQLSQKSQSNEKTTSENKKRPKNYTSNYGGPKIKTSHRDPPQLERTTRHYSPQNRSVKSPRTLYIQDPVLKLEKEKSLSQRYADETFFYRKLHNRSLWKWDHFEQFCQIQKNPNARPCKVSAGVLERFRDHMEKKVGKRVPLVVKDLFDRKPMKY